MSRDAIMTDLKVLLRKHAAKFIDDVDSEKFSSAKQRLEQILALMDAVVP